MLVAAAPCVQVLCSDTAHPIDFLCNRECRVPDRSRPLSPLPVTESVAVFGVVSGQMTGSVVQSDVIAFSSLLSKRLILFKSNSAVFSHHIDTSRCGVSGRHFPTICLRMMRCDPIPLYICPVLRFYFE